MDDELIYQYLDCIKSIKELSWSEAALILPKDINRAYFHEQMCIKILGFDKNEYQSRYIRFKEITDNLDKVCEIYSDAEEWKLTNRHDVSMMTKYLSNFLSKCEIKMYIDGDTEVLHCIKN